MDRYRISDALPPQDQRILLQAQTGGQASFVRVTLYLDDEPLATFDQPPYQLWWPLQSGVHRVHAVGETSDGQTISSEPILFNVVDSTS